MYGIRSISSIIAGITISFSIFFEFLYSSLTFFIAGIISLIIIYPFIKNKTISNSKKQGGLRILRKALSLSSKKKDYFNLHYYLRF
jgi:hypothetical protein